MSDTNDPPHFTCIWTIQNMCFPCDAVSPTFTVEEMEVTKWGLRIYNETLEFIKFCIFRKEEDYGPDCIEVRFELSFLGSDGLPLIEKTDEKVFKKGEFSEHAEFANKNEVLFGRRMEFLPKDALTVRCRMWRTGTGTGILKLDSCFARTRLSPDRRNFVWAVREFKDLQRGQERKLLLKATPTNQFAFKLFITENNGEEYISIDLECCTRLIIIKICLLDQEGGVVHSEENFGGSGDSFLFHHFFEKGRLLGDEVSLLPNDVLTLRCEIDLLPHTAWSLIECYRYLKTMNPRMTATDAAEVTISHVIEKSPGASPPLTEAMESLLQEDILSDVNLQTESKSFPAHKCILNARSPACKALLSVDMEYTKSKLVVPVCFREDTLKELLSYIYANAVRYDLEWEVALDLYKAADKFELLDLKQHCRKILKSDFSVSNVCAVLIAAHTHHDAKLRKYALRFMVRKGIEFFTSDAWERFKEGNLELALDTLERLFLM